LGVGLMAVTLILDPDHNDPFSYKHRLVYVKVRKASQGGSNRNKAPTGAGKKFNSKIEIMGRGVISGRKSIFGESTGLFI